MVFVVLDIFIFKGYFIYKKLLKIVFYNCVGIKIKILMDLLLYIYYFYS